MDLFVVYLGDMWLKDIYLYPGRVTWLEARDICWSQGGIMPYSLWKKAMWYIWTKANKENWWVALHPPIGGVYDYRIVMDT